MKIKTLISSLKNLFKLPPTEEEEWEKYGELVDKFRGYLIDGLIESKEGENQND